MRHSESVMRRFVDRFINGGDESVLSEVVHADYTYRSPEEGPRGRDGLATDDATALSFTLTGTHRGEQLGVMGAAP